MIIGGKNEGIHAFLVRIREADHTPSKGVRIHDMGKKMECNGVDNGFHAVVGFILLVTALGADRENLRALRADRDNRDLLHAEAAHS